MLSDKEQGESVVSYIDGKRIWEVKKIYDSIEFNNDSSSLGYGIDVYQESINKTFREYLVNFDYLTRTLNSYGFALLTADEAKKINLPNATGMFEELYNSMRKEIKYESKSSRRKNTQLSVGVALELADSPEQQKISFLNRYFVYRKINHVNSEQITDIIMDKSPMQLKLEDTETEEAEAVAKAVVKRKKKPRKLLRKFKLKLPPKANVDDET